jgi:hypothetical protein
MIQRLEAFIPLVGNTHVLQNGRNAQRDWFLKAAAKANPRIESGQTAQGFYVMGADGEAFGFNNNRSLERVLGFASKGLEAFAGAPKTKVEIPAPQDFQPKPPPGTFVLRAYSRISPVPAGSDPANENVQRDHLWVLEGELGATVSEAFAKRLCRFALVDAIRGEPDFWRPSEVRTSSFRVVRPGRLEGEFSMATADGKRGLEGKLEAEFAVQNGRIQSFKGYAEGLAWGRGTYTPSPPAGRFPIKFAFVAAPKSADTVAPQAAMFGREYVAP